MGCDIHFYTERFTTDNNYKGPRDISEERHNKLDTLLNEEELKPRWVSADVWDYEDEDGDKYWQISWEDKFYNGRNYKLFELLAGVRGYDENAISPPRGIPDDVSYGYRTIVDLWDSDGHSHSYYTLDELLDIDWSKYKDFDSFLLTIEKMKNIDPDTKNVRCVFFFDN
jgi:hypothetical protein